MDKKTLEEIARGTKSSLPYTNPDILPTIGESEFRYQERQWARAQLRKVESNGK